MPTFSNLNSLFNYIGKNTKFALQDVGSKVEELLKDYIIKNLYQAYTPEDYSRTYDYINSITVSKVEQIGNGQYSVRIYFDTDKIRPLLADDDRFWNRHMDVYGNTDWKGKGINEWMPLWIEEGTNGSLWDREGIHAVENTTDFVENTKFHIKEIKKLLESKGFKVVFGK